MRCRAPAGPGRSPPGGPCAPLEAAQRVPLTAGCRPACHRPPAGGPPGPRGVPQNCLACVSRPLCPPRPSTAPPRAWRARVIGPRARREQCEALGWLALRPAWTAVCPGDKPGPLTCSPGLQGRPSRVAPAAPVVTRPGSWELGAALQDLVWPWPRLGCGVPPSAPQSQAWDGQRCARGCPLLTGYGSPGGPWPCGGVPQEQHGGLRPTAPRSRLLLACACQRGPPGVTRRLCHSQSPRPLLLSWLTTSSSVMG